MPIYANLSSLEVNNEKNGCCEFNGYLEDYLAVNSECEHAEMFEQILAISANLKIIVGLRLDIRHDVITNRIIRYKDAFKNAEKAIHYPYVIYGKNNNDEERAIILCGNSKEEYLLGKGLYYCLCEPDSIFDKDRNELISCGYENAVDSAKKLFEENLKTGAVQRKLDQVQFTSYDELYKVGLAYATSIKDNLKDALANKTEEERHALIKSFIVSWFLIKKVVYVQYMMNKSLLGTHNNNIKEQRTIAKQNADSIPFCSFKEMWRI